MILEARYAVDGLSRVLMHGKDKYDRGNWRNGLKHTEVCDSLLRHLSAYLSGEDYDSDSGERHVDHVLANALFLAELIRTRPDLDDRSVLLPLVNKEWEDWVDGKLKLSITSQFPFGVDDGN